LISHQVIILLITKFSTFSKSHLFELDMITLVSSANKIGLAYIDTFDILVAQDKPKINLILTTSDIQS